MKNAFVFVGVAVLLATGALFWQKELNPDTCQAYCMSNESCMRMLDSEGIAPYGSTRNDKALCNGICSTLATQARQAQKHARELGVPAGSMDFSNACIPQK